jgi:hypothetical protein
VAFLSSIRLRQSVLHGTVGLVAVILFTGCSATTMPGPQDGLIIAQGEQFFVRGGAMLEPFIPWGFNYDRTAIDGRDVLLEDVLRERPAKIDADFAEMRRLGGNCVRVFLGTAWLLEDARRVRPDALRELDIVLNAADRHGLRLIVVGLANIRPASAPAWLRDADDTTMAIAEGVFWRTVARHCRGRACVMAYDLQNEPVVSSRANESWTGGCFNMSHGQQFCYVHRHFRQIDSLWTRHIQDKYGSALKLRLRWPDFPREGESWEAIAPPRDAKDPRYGEFIALHGMLLREWTARLVGVIRQEDPDHLVTVGALDPRVMADVVDFHCLHLYPAKLPAERNTRDEQKRIWRGRVEGLPRGKPIVIEEFFPLGGAPGARFEDTLADLLEATSPRATGWVSFYWGLPSELATTNAMAAAIYESWLKIWTDGRSLASSQPAATSGPGR